MQTVVHLSGTWLKDLRKTGADPKDGLVAIAGHAWRANDPRQVVVLERAEAYGADFVLFRPGTPDHPVVPEALVFVEDGLSDDEFAQLHRRLWNWGGVPLVFRKRAGRVDLLRCAHGPDFAAQDGRLRYRAYDTLNLLATLDEATPAPWWDLTNLQAGSLWDDPKVCNVLLSSKDAAQNGLMEAIAARYEELSTKGVLPEQLRRRLLILSLLIAYLEDRNVLDREVFARCKPGAIRFFEVLSDGPGLCALLAELEVRFNGDVFSLTDGDRAELLASSDLERYAALVEGRTEGSGQTSLWQLYSFRDLPVELISHVYQHFVRDDVGAVYTPPFLVRLMLDEALGRDRLDRLSQTGEVLLDPSCGSGVFLVEAYKRLIAHWRARNEWAHPDAATLRRLMLQVHGVDINTDAIELTAFSLCLALCEALDTNTLRTSTKLFPKLRDVSLHRSCFFDAAKEGLLGDDIGVVIGNPPFRSQIPPSAQPSYERWGREIGSLPDKQLAYLFLLECLSVLRPGGLLCLLQQYNLLYNKNAAGLRNHIFTHWDVREVLDFISVRGLFGAAADTKVVALIVEAQRPPEGRRVLHATFRRTGRVAAKRGFDIDYYDLHWLKREHVLADLPVWRSNLVGGGRVVDLVTRLRSMRTLGEYATACNWDVGQGFITGGSRVHERPDAHVRGKRYLPSKALGPNGLDASKISISPDSPVEEPRSPERFTAPMLLVRLQVDLHHAFVPSGYLTYPDQVVGLCAPKSDAARLRQVQAWMDRERQALRAYVAASSPKVQKATALMQADIEALPFPASGSLDISPNESIVIADIVDHYREFVRVGEKSAMLRPCKSAALVDFCEVYLRHISAVYRGLRRLPACHWPGAICQPFVFGQGEVDWSDADTLRGRLASVLREQRGESLLVHRIARIFDGPYIFLLKPDRLRYWLRSVALRDADDTLAELHAQGL